MNTIPPNKTSTLENIDRPRRSLALSGLAGVVLLGAIGAGTANHSEFTAHEWGTFTSVQGGDGDLLDWRPLESSKLPGFVYDWTKPGLKRQGTSPAIFGKTSMVTLQRMETPVIYFYSGKELDLDVSVGFPKGLITEWYPQAANIGPSAFPPTPTITKLDKAAHDLGAKPDFTFATYTGHAPVRDSRAEWSHVHVLPAEQHPEIQATLPSDRSGSHYFAARDTDSDFLSLDSLDSARPGSEHEKFLFYRGAGNFPTPLKVTMPSEHKITVQNTGPEAIDHLFVLGLAGRSGKFLELKSLGAGEKRTMDFDPGQDNQTLDKLQPLLAAQMTEALAAEGLYKREASAMVNTWKDSWLAEEGIRVLYTLPRSWTDATLPLKINPAPKEVVRVMVGRAEVLSPAREQNLARMLTSASRGDKTAQYDALAEIKRLGRFAEPALRLALRGSDQQVNQSAWSLMATARAPEPQRAL
jgi:hypothetical protein